MYKGYFSDMLIMGMVHGSEGCLSSKKGRKYWCYIGKKRLISQEAINKRLRNRPNGIIQLGKVENIALNQLKNG